MITADTITDEEIRELRVASAKGLVTTSSYYSADFMRGLCDDALDADGMRGDAIEYKARARCAEILNTRKESP